MARRSKHQPDGPRASAPGPEDYLIRRALKRTIERVLASDAVTRRTQRKLRGSRLILAYHGIVPRGFDGPVAAERALFVPQSRFAAQLDVLRDVADVAPLDRIDDAGDGRPRVAITFDDAYAGAVTAGVQELVAHGLPATMFVAPGRLDGHVFWWDALAGESGVLDPGLRRYALSELGGADERIRAWAGAARGTASVPAFARSATVGELDHAMQTPLLTLGSHSWSHPSLAALTPEALHDELARPRAWLAERFGQRAINWCAYPYGLSSAAVLAATAAAGYDAALDITGGWHRATEGVRFARPRLTIGAGMSVDGFRARILGALSTR
jgi:peptidoglycan/xylan/chitin deacetylase (PgdA/CDA1 family)